MAADFSEEDYEERAQSGKFVKVGDDGYAQRSIESNTGGMAGQRGSAAARRCCTCAPT